MRCQVPPSRYRNLSLLCPPGFHSVPRYHNFKISRPTKPPPHLGLVPTFSSAHNVRHACSTNCYHIFPIIWGTAFASFVLYVPLSRYYLSFYVQVAFAQHPSQFFLIIYILWNDCASCSTRFWVLYIGVLHSMQYHRPSNTVVTEHLNARV